MSDTAWVSPDADAILARVPDLDGTDAEPPRRIITDPVILAYFDRLDRVCAGILARNPEVAASLNLAPTSPGPGADPAAPPLADHRADSRAAD